MIDKYLDIETIDPKYWGKSGWIFLNSIALTYKPEYKEKYKMMLLQFPYILPCNTCGEKLKINLLEIDSALENKETFLRWLIKIRNEVYKQNNTNINKNIEDTIYEIFQPEKKCISYYYLSVLFLILILLLFTFKKIYLAKKSN